MVIRFPGRHLVAALLFCAGAAGHPGLAHAQSFTIIAEDEWFPYSAERDGTPVGFAVDLVRAAYAAVGVEVVLRSMPFARCMEEVSSGAELGCFDTVREADTVERFHFHRTPLFAATLVIVAPADSSETNLTYADLKGRKVACTLGYTYGEPFQSDASIEKDFVQSDLSVLRLVANGRAPYGAVFDLVKDSLVAENAAELSGKLKVVGRLSHLDLYVAFSKERPESPAAADLLDSGLALIRANGTSAAIEQRWLRAFTGDSLPEAIGAGTAP